MPELWMIVGAAAGLVLVFGLTRPRREVAHFDDEREERLTRRMAREVGCSLSAGLPSVRRELKLAPSLPDDTIVKRAIYHYRREMPDAPCPVFRGSRPG
jgi:hypothetical protein